MIENNYQKARRIFFNTPLHVIRTEDYNQSLRDALYKIMKRSGKHTGKIFKTRKRAGKLYIWRVK